MGEWSGGVLWRIFSDSGRLSSIAHGAKCLAQEGNIDLMTPNKLSIKFIKLTINEADRSEANDARAKRMDLTLTAGRFNTLLSLY